MSSSQYIDPILSITYMGGVDGGLFWTNSVESTNEYEWIISKLGGELSVKMVCWSCNQALGLGLGVVFRVRVWGLKGSTSLQEIR